MLNLQSLAVVLGGHSLTLGILFTAVLFLVYGVLGLLSKAVPYLLPILAIVAAVLLLLGK